MMSLLLSSVSASALMAGGVTPPFEAFVYTERTYDPATVSVQTITNGNKTIQNLTGAANTNYVTSIFEMPPGDKGRYYWEFHCVDDDLGPGTFDGYQGVVSASMYNSPTWDHDSGNNPIQFGSIGYRGNGSLWANGSNRASMIGYGIYSNLMFAFIPETGEFWAGKDGIWRTREPSQPALWTSSEPNLGFKVSGQGRNNREGGTLVTTPAEFIYDIPPTFVPLSYLQFAPIVDTAMTSFILGGSNVKPTLQLARTYAVMGSYSKGPSILKYNTHVIVEE